MPSGQEIFFRARSERVQSATVGTWSQIAEIFFLDHVKGPMPMYLMNAERCQAQACGETHGLNWPDVHKTFDEDERKLVGPRQICCDCCRASPVVLRCAPNLLITRGR